MNPIHQFNEREAAEFEEKLIYHDEEHFVIPQCKECYDILKSHLQASNTRAMQFVLDRVREAIGPDERTDHHDFEDNREAHFINAEKAKTRQLLDDLSALMEQK